MTLFGTATGGYVPTNVQFTASAASVAESIGTYTVTVYKTLADGNVSGELALSGTATEGGGSDYTVDTTNFTMNGATTSATFVVTVNDDAEIESGETVVLTLANVAGGTVVSPSVFTLTITDNDVPPVTPEGILSFRFNSAPYLPVSVNETGITVSAMSLTSGTIETNISTGTYFPDEPYIDESGGWTASAQASAKAFQFTITPDVGSSVTITAISFRAYATAAGPSAFGYTIGGGLATFEINAPDAALVVVSQAVTGVENQSTPVLVQIQGWTNGSRSTVGTGNFRLDDVVVFGVIAAATPTTNVLFTAGSASVDEAVNAYTVTVYKTQADGNISGEVALSGTASEGGGADYTVDTTNFTMNGATTSATFVVTVNDDAVVESGETVVLTLANVIGGTVASPSVFTLTITDNDVAPEVPEGIAAFRFSAGPHLQVSTKDANISVTDMSLGSGTIETNVTTGTYFPNEPYAEETSGWAVDNQAAAKSFRFTLTPNVGYQVSITGISFRTYATASGPSVMGYDIGGAASYSFNATNDTLITVSQAVAGVDNQAGAVFIQIQGWTNGTRQSSGTGAFRLDDVVVFGVVASLGDTPPVLGAIGNKTVLTNAPLSFAVTATPTEGDTVTLSVSNALPAGATFGSTNEVGTFEWLAPGPVGVYTMTFYAADNDGVDTEQITITVTSTPVDIDGDLLPNDWENQYFGGATNATATADDDGDGYLNVEEFVAQTIPVLPNGATSYFRNVSIAASGRSVGYPSVTGRQYRLWGSTNLIPGIDWTQVAGPQVGNGSAQSLQEGSGTTSSVFRLTVELTNP